jgi:hypothetical protein
MSTAPGSSVGRIEGGGRHIQWHQRSMPAAFRLGIPASLPPALLSSNQACPSGGLQEAAGDSGPGGHVLRETTRLWHSSTPNARFLSHSPSAPPPPFTQSPYPPRSLVRDGQTHPHRPRLVVSHSTCPPLSSSPHAHSFVIGPAVIKHTHTRGRRSRLGPGRRREPEACHGVAYVTVFGAK